MAIETMNELWKRAKAHDYWYCMTEDPGVYGRGRDDRDEIVRAARRLGPEAQEMVAQMWEHKRGSAAAPPPEPKP